MERPDHFAWVQKLVNSGIAIPPDTASANLIGRVVIAAVARGANRPALLEAIGIPDAMLQNQLVRVPGQILNRLLAATEAQLGNPAIALEIGRDSRPSCFSDIGYATRLLPTLYDVLNENVLMQDLRQNLYRVVLSEAGPEVVLNWNLMGQAPDSLSSAIEFSLATYVWLAREILGNALKINHIALQHAPRFDPALYEQILGYPVQFSAKQTSINFAAHQCRAPSPIANAKLLEASRQTIERAMEWRAAGKRYSSLTYFYVRTELNKSPVTLDRVARSLGMAERTLRRHLVEEGNPFRLLLDEMRKALCNLYRMEAKRSLSEVAELLGYGELSAFTRAYRRWYGEPPSRNWQALL